MYKFNRYIKSTKFRPSRNEVIYSTSLMLFLPSVFYLCFWDEKDIPNFLNVLFVIAIFLPLVGKFIRVLNEGKHKPLNGHLKDEIILELEKITINNTEFHLSNIKKIEFSCFDYKDLSFRSLGYNSDLNNPLSNGVDNTIKIVMNDLSIYTYNFQQLYEFEIRNATSELVNYYISGKLHFLNLIDTLGYTDYEEIQKFKVTLPRV
jgi:hypothetical protein